LNWFLILGLVYLLMVAVGVLSQGFRTVSGGADGAEAIFEFATNPLVSVLLGVLATALVQSSSAVTSVIVGLVGGGLPIAIAIPMIIREDEQKIWLRSIQSAAESEEGDEEAIHRFKACR
jgi:sodium-dependent phosphate cotransporter